MLTPMSFASRFIALLSCAALALAGMAGCAGGPAPPKPSVVKAKVAAPPTVAAKKVALGKNVFLEIQATSGGWCQARLFAPGPA